MEKKGHADLDIWLLAVIGIISVLLLIEIVVVAEAYFYNILEEENIAKQVDQPVWELREIVLSQQAELNSYRWVDRERRRVSIPIDRAIGRFVELQAEQAATRPARN